MRRFLISLAILGLAARSGNAAPIPESPRAQAVISQQTPQLATELVAVDAEPGAAVYLRIFKEERQLELWIVGLHGYTLYKTYPICAVSGALGPKLARGDNQAPEGFYDVAPGQLNPASAFHLSIDVGYPNAYDHAHGRTGANLMIHGNCVSIGCYAMTDSGIDEIYTLAHEALAAGAASVPVHIFPFRMTDENLRRHATDRWLDFWHELKPAYVAFDRDHMLPQITVAAGHYEIASHD
jgi:murein L,D-transpeptidase YafK